MKKLICLLALTLALTGCSSSSDSASSSSSVTTTTTESAMEDTVTSTGGGMTTTKETQGNKFIYTVYLEGETIDFETDATALKDLVASMDGYFEYASEENYGSYRRGSYTIRLETSQLDAFTEQTSAVLLITDFTSQVEDISYQYYDTQGRLETQQLKLERLQALLEQAETMEDLITLESAISETQEAIDNYSGTMVYYNSQVDYATVELTLREVSTLSNVELTPVGFGGRLGNAFTNGITNFIDGLGDMAIWLAYNWLGMAVWLVVIVVAVKVVRRKSKVKVPKMRKLDLKDNEDKEN
ncbi:DUF4349 domain-containing protein [Bengtsoniella intestinalis]|uniref:DUF4349 domain-containing protein n=1 Tax=Bengtsoniella intestinalis TaxID=3073143 RepID=UPI00391F560C